MQCSRRWNRGVGSGVVWTVTGSLNTNQELLIMLKPNTLRQGDIVVTSVASTVQVIHPSKCTSQDIIEN